MNAVVDSARMVRSRARRLWRRVSAGNRQREDTRRSLLEMLPSGSVGAEIGVWKGDFSDRILSVVEPSHLHLIDPWKFEGGEKYGDAWYGGKVAGAQPGMDTVHAGVLARFEGPIREGIVHVHRMSSVEAASRFADNFFDWVYIAMATTSTSS